MISRIFRRSRLVIAVCSLTGPLLCATPEAVRIPLPVVEPVTQLEAVRVSAKRIAAADVEGPQAIENYDPDRILNTGAFDVVEFLDTLPPPEPGTKQLVLVDGRPTYLDLGSLPLGMIEGIDVSRDGSMPQLGAYTNGRIINIRLKKEYVGVEAGGKFTGAFAGGGQQRNLRLSMSVKHGKDRTLVAVNLRQSGALAAADRAFSRDQDHRARGGRDLRLPWGYPAVVEAVAGALANTGHAVLLVPPGAASAPASAADFLLPNPAIGSSAANQRRFDTAPYRNLANPSTSAGMNFNHHHTFSERLQLSFTASYRRDTSTRPGPPPVTPASAATLVPAAYNPFGQDVRVGLVHVGFGPTHQTTRSERLQLGLQADGQINPSWRWEAGVGRRRNTSHQRTPDLDPDQFSAALRSTDPALRFDPFVDGRVAPGNARLYPALTADRLSDQVSESTELDLSLKGTLATWTGGPVALTVDGEHNENDRERASNRVPGGALTYSEVESRSQEASASLILPFIGAANARPMLRRLEGQWSARYGTASNDGAQRNAETGLVWSPVTWLLLRGRYARSTDAPPQAVVAGTETLADGSLIDPRRGGEPLANVSLLTHGAIDAKPQQNEHYSFGATVEPSILPGLRLRASYRARVRTNLYESEFDPQDIVNNEAALTGRVARAAPLPTDVALGQPGVITSVDVTPGSTGRSVRRDLEFDVDYRTPERPFGIVRLDATVERQLKSVYEVLPGVTFVEQNVGASRRPKWTASGLLAWSRHGWNASTRVSHTGAVPSSGEFAGLEPETVVDLHVGVRLSRPAKLGRRRHEARIAASIGNVFDTGPQWADTLSGYQSGSALGRTYSLALTLQL